MVTFSPLFTLSQSFHSPSSFYPPSFLIFSFLYFSDHPSFSRLFPSLVFNLPFLSPFHLSLFSACFLIHFSSLSLYPPFIVFPAFSSTPPSSPPFWILFLFPQPHLPVSIKISFFLLRTPPRLFITSSAISYFESNLEYIFVYSFSFLFFRFIFNGFTYKISSRNVLSRGAGRKHSLNDIIARARYHRQPSPNRQARAKIDKMFILTLKVWIFVLSSN